MVVVKSDSGINSLSDLSGKVVVVQTDSSALHALEGDDASEENKQLASTFTELQQVGDYNTAFLNLSSGAGDAICMDIGVASYEISARNGEFKMLDEHISSEKYGVGFLKGNTELRDTVQATLSEMAKDGTLDKIADEWSDKGIDKTSLCFDPNEKPVDTGAEAAE